MDYPGPFDRGFLDDMPYDPQVLLLDRVEQFDRQARRIVCRMPTDQPMPFTQSQRVDPVTHPLHVSGAVMVHVTGMLGFVMLYHIHDLRHAQGWTGYGTHIHRAVFRKLVTPGVPMMCSCHEVRTRKMGDRIFSTYEFEFLHEGEVAYESKQSAMWMKLR
ncbi:MAG: hypothetical protein MUF54_09610 [Polyangiaceae bacterium]|jgi:hypothetical protein|nr:hypothetical protein [Polyangiaceae bacterium]